MSNKEHGNDRKNASRKNRKCSKHTALIVLRQNFVRIQENF